MKTNMDGGTIATNSLITSIDTLNTESKEQERIKAILQNFLSPDVRKNDILCKNETYNIPVKPPPRSYLNSRMKSINAAKEAFLNSTVTDTQPTLHTETIVCKEDPKLHYAQIVITTESDDTRSTGGGIKSKENIISKPEIDSKSQLVTLKKKLEQQRKISFKIKNASVSHRRPPLAAKTTMTIPSNKVSELTKKFNNLVKESQNGSVTASKLAKTIENLQNESKHSGNVNSTSSSALSSSPNIKIVVRQRKGSRKRFGKKRCSSFDSIDKLVVTDNKSSKIQVIRSKSDSNKIPKLTKNRSKHQYQSGSDSVDGTPVKAPARKVSDGKDSAQSNVVKHAIQKFECEIIAKSNTLTRKNVNENKNEIIAKDKPKVPEKKSTLVLTKNIIVKDGVPKIKTLKPTSCTNSDSTSTLKRENSVLQKKEPIYDKRKYKTSYIHSEKMPLKLVEIIHEDADQKETSKSCEKTETAALSDETETKHFENAIIISNKEKVYQDVTCQIAPNESFLWRRKSTAQIYSECDRTALENSLNSINITISSDNSATPTGSMAESQCNHFEIQNENISVSSNMSIVSINHEHNPDFESSLVEAYNKDIIIGTTTKPASKIIEEDDYEPLEPYVPSENIAPVKKMDRNSKINCPLPEIPKESKDECVASSKENIYQCLLEMRSHPEGDESSVHNYEMCDDQLEERTRGDGDSDNGYEYCKSPIKPYCHTSSSGIHIAEDYRPYSSGVKNYNITKSVSGASTISYEKIGSERIYEKIPSRTSKTKNISPGSSGSRHSIASTEYTSYNEGENIYDTIKHADGVSLSHCYESIPNSPSFVKMRSNKRLLPSAVQKRLSFDTVSNISQSTLSSEQKTNSIYGQRSMISFNGQEIAFQVPSSETSASDRSDRSDEWVDVSDDEKNDQQQIVIVHERSRGRKSPLSWAQKVRHQWEISPKPKQGEKVFITSPSNVYIETSTKSPHYSPNDDTLARRRRPKEVEQTVDILQLLEDKCWLSIRTVLRDGEIEIQDLIAFIEGDSSDSGHVYESLEPAILLDDDIDSFDSDSDTDHHDDKPLRIPSPTHLQRLPEPPTGGAPYTLTKIASAAQKKMRQLKRNLTKRYSVAIDGKPFSKSSPTQNTIDTNNKSKSPIYANYQRPEIHHYTNITYPEPKLENLNGTLKKELKYVNGDKKIYGEKRIYGEVAPPLPDKPPPEKPTTPVESKKENGTLSRKTYFSFKSRFRRASSMAVDINDVPSALKMTNSTFYLTDSVDGDSGFSNCSESCQTGSSERLSVSGRGRNRAESTPCLAPLERPTAPPPPPPPVNDLAAVNEELKRLLPTLSRKDKGPRTRTSWYAECGATDDLPSPRPSSTSWYAEAGLVQAGNISSSSGASSGSHPASPLPRSLFTHEPLYQFYNAAKLESVCRDTVDSDSDAYEPSYGPPAASPAPVPDTSPSPATAPSPAAAARPSAMTLVAPRGPARTLWCEVPEVIASAVLSSLAPSQKRLQEAKFELLTSEASYLNSLNVLESHFISHPAFRDANVLPPCLRETLFATIIPVRKCSQLLMNSLEKCWQENILLTGICDIVRKHAEEHFHVYVKYCENQTLMVRALQTLRSRPQFAAALRRVESSPWCQSLSLHSFLLLPMQRVTRLPLLLDAVLRHLQRQDPEYQDCMDALATLNGFVSQCNEGARNTERIEEMFRLSQIIEFPGSIRDPPSLGPACARRDRRPIRWLVRSGEMTQLIWKTEELKLTFGKKYHKIPLHLFLFNDLLVITKKKGEDNYVAIDHCHRSLLEVCASDGGAAQAKHALLVTLLENHEGRTVEMLMSCPTETDARRWSEALTRGTGDSGASEGEAVYAGWDCPQVAALYAYTPAQPDELPLSEGDVVNVTRKTSEGWYYGERIRDGEAGWFPGSYTAEIASAHVRARNLRQRYRLLALSRTYLGQKKKTN